MNESMAPLNTTTATAGSSKKRRLYLCSCSLFFLIIGGMWGAFWHNIIDYFLQQEMALRQNTQVYENWKTPPVELHLDIYLYNWTNAEDLGVARPSLQQVGPYRFREVPDKVDIDWHPENASVSYRRLSHYYFDSAGSAGRLDDVVTTINAVALSAAAKAKHWQAIRRSVVDMGLKVYHQHMTVTKTVDELLFSGYQDTMIDVARAMPVFGKDVEVPFDRFGWFYMRNGSADLTGVFNVFTGSDDIKKLGKIHTWNYKTQTGFFRDECGRVKGSAGEFQQRQLNEHGSVGIFLPDMCRMIPLDYVETVSIESVKGYKYVGGLRSIDNGTKYPGNACFCGGECLPSGVMNVSACRFGAPVFMSYPHFYNGDPYFVQQVEGLHPNKDQHELYMIVEPRTGIVLEVAARFQVNMLIEPIESVSLYEQVPRIVLPVIWFEQKVRITPQMANELRILSLLILFGWFCALGCLLLGTLSLLTYVYLSVKARHLLQTTARDDGIKPTLGNGDAAIKQVEVTSLLLQNKSRAKILCKSDTVDSIKTTTTVYSGPPVD